MSNKTDTYREIDAIVHAVDMPSKDEHSDSELSARTATTIHAKNVKSIASTA